MRLSLFLPLLGSVWAVPTEPSHILDDPQLDRRAVAATTQNTIKLNSTICYVTVDGWSGFDFRVAKMEGTLAITQGLPTPGTKNGQNIYDMSLITKSQSWIGSIRFATNAYLSNYPGGSFPGLADYAIVSRTPAGGVKADLDGIIGSLPIPPLRFTTGSLERNSPIVTYIPTKGWLNVILTGKDVYGWIWLENGYSLDEKYTLGRYYAEISGWCVNGTMPFTPPS